MANISIPIEITEEDIAKGKAKISFSVRVSNKDKLILSGLVSPFIIESSFKSDEKNIDTVTDSDGQIKILHSDMKSSKIINGHIIVIKLEDKKEEEI